MIPPQTERKKGVWRIEPYIFSFPVLLCSFQFSDFVWSDLIG